MPKGMALSIAIHVWFRGTEQGRIAATTGRFCPVRFPARNRTGGCQGCSARFRRSNGERGWKGDSPDCRVGTLEADILVCRILHCVTNALIRR